MKNHKNDRIDASLQVDHMGMFMVPVWSPSSHQGGYPASLPPGMVAKRGRRSPSTMSRVGSWKLSMVQSPRSAGKLTAGHGRRSPPIRLDNYVSNGSIYAYIIPGGFPGRILLDWFPKGGCKNTQSIVYYLKKNSHSHACINTPGIRKQTLLFYG